MAQFKIGELVEFLGLIIEGQEKPSYIPDEYPLGVYMVTGFDKTDLGHKGIITEKMPFRIKGPFFTQVVHAVGEKSYRPILDQKADKNIEFQVKTNV